MNGWLKGWLASEAANHDKIEVKRIYIDLNEGNLYDGVIFSQIMYWHGVSRETGKPRMSIERDGNLWLVKGYGDWWEECRIIEPTARAAINRIANRGLIVKKLWKFNGAPTLHIRMDWESLEEQLMWLCDEVSNGFDSKYQIGNDTSYQNDPIADVKSLTDTTSDTTTDTTAKKKRTRNSSSKKKDKTPITQLRARLEPHTVLAAALLDLFDAGYKQSIHKPCEYLITQVQLEKYVPILEDLALLKATADEVLAVHKYLKPGYTKNGWTVGLKTIVEKLPAYRAWRDSGGENKIITGVWGETTPPELPDVGLSPEERKALVSGTKKAVSA